MINRTEAYDLINYSQIELAKFLNTVNAIRRDHWGNLITYSRKVFIPLTNMCRDQCRYCTFVQTPDSDKAGYMTPDAVLRTALQGQNAGCKEALFSLGERPELRYRLARALLHQQGYDNTIDYLHDMAELVVNRTLLVPHINAGALSYQELKKLRPVAGSMGMMIESLTDTLMKKGQAHHGCPDKAPQRRLETLRSAGKLSIPFTTGLLIGIGETWQQRIDSLFAINDLYLEYGHIQEVIIQNFRAKPGTPMADYPEPTLHDMLLTLAAARAILHPGISLQAPPNLEASHTQYLEAGINDWGGISPVTRDFINPERAWPQISQLAEKCHALGYELSERLTVYPAYLGNKEKYLAPQIANRLASLSSHLGQATIQRHTA